MIRSSTITNVDFNVFIFIDVFVYEFFSFSALALE